MSIRRCRVTHVVFISGVLVEPGDEFHLPLGERGPHVTHQHKHDHMDVNADQKRILPDLHDEPLYEEWDGSRWVKGRGTESA